MTTWVQEENAYQISMYTTKRIIKWHHQIKEANLIRTTNFCAFTWVNSIRLSWNWLDARLCLYRSGKIYWMKLWVLNKRKLMNLDSTKHALLRTILKFLIEKEVKEWDCVGLPGVSWNKLLLWYPYHSQDLQLWKKEKKFVGMRTISLITTTCMLQ